MLCNGYLYSSYHIISPANFPEQCQWEGPVKNRYLSGNDQKTISDSTVEGCKAACEEECGFHCTSFDYIPSTKKCYLQMVNRYQNVLTSSTSYDFYERNCFSKWYHVFVFQYKTII